MNARQLEAARDAFRVIADHLSDGSVAYNVVGTIDGVRLTFACESEEKARVLAKNLEDCAWFEAEVQS